MNFTDLIAMLIATGGLVGALAIIGQAYQRRLDHKERLAELKHAAPATAPGAGQADTIERLEHRLRVLERIATDKSAKLSAEIEDLREPAN